MIRAFHQLRVCVWMHFEYIPINMLFQWLPTRGSWTPREVLEASSGGAVKTSEKNATVKWKVLIKHVLNVVF